MDTKLWDPNFGPLNPSALTRATLTRHFLRSSCEAEETRCGVTTRVIGLLHEEVQSQKESPKRPERDHLWGLGHRSNVAKSQGSPNSSIWALTLRVNKIPQRQLQEAAHKTSVPARALMHTKAVIHAKSYSMSRTSGTRHGSTTKAVMQAIELVRVKPKQSYEHSPVHI